MLILHQFHLSPFNEKVQRLLNFKGVPFEEKYWRIADRGKILKISPTGKLPALEHDGRIVCDSTDMVHYLEEKFPNRPLIPAHPKPAGMVHVLEDWADESLYFYEMRLRFGTPGNQERNIPRLIANEPPALRWLLGHLLPRVLRKTTATQGIGRKSRDQLQVDTERHIAAVAGLLGEDEWLLANRITLADLAVYAMMQCFRDADISLELLNKYPSVTDWMERVEANTSTRASSPEGGEAP
jgi:glutathione S-transferase